MIFMKSFRLFIFLLSLVLINKSFGQVPFFVKYLGIENGLSNNAVTSIYQDRNGFMWFGTYDGLNKYDGYSFQTFRNVIGDSTSLSDNHIYCIEGDNNNNIWIGGLKGVSIYDAAKLKFRTPRYIPIHSQTTIHLTDETNTIRCVDNTMFVGTTTSGLILFKKGNSTGKQVPIDHSKTIAENYSVTYIEYDSVHHQIWAFVNGIGLCKYNFNKEQLELVNDRLQQATCLLRKKDGNILIGTDNGLYLFNPFSNTNSNSLFASRVKVMHLIEDEQNTLWIASDGAGLWRLPPNAKTPIAYSSPADGEALNSNSIYAIYEDTDNRKWIGTLRGGINIMERKVTPFKKISLGNGQKNAANDFILSFSEDEKSNVWIGTDGAGLVYWDRLNNSYTTIVHSNMPNAISSNFVTNIAQDDQNNMWVSTWFGGINRMNKATRTFKHYACYNDITQQYENNVWLLYEDRQKRLWASTTNNGHLYIYNKTNDKFELFDNSILNFQSLAEDGNGNLWGGTYTSLVLLDVANKHHKVYPIGYPVRFIHEDSHHNFWIGTEGGGLLLFDRKKGTYTRLTTKDGLPSNTMLRILEDPNGDLWLSTYNGLCKFNPVSKICRNFYESDGLQSNQFSFNAALALKSGDFLFGGIRGFNIFNPSNVFDKKSDPRLFLTGLRINNVAVEDDDSYITERNMNGISMIRVPFDKAVLSMDFIALDYSDADKFKYAYYLQGWDKSWNMVNNGRIANYSRLQEGEYTFLVKVMNADGVWSKEKVLLTIQVLPPWYRTWWAYLIYFSIAGIFIYAYILYNKKQELNNQRQERLRYEIKLTQVESEKEKEIIKRRIAFFTHVSHEFRTPLTLIINPLKELLSDEANIAIHKKMTMIQRNAKRLLSLVDQLLLFEKVESIEQQLRIEKFNIVETCNEVFLSFVQHAAAKHIAFSFHKPDNEIWLYGDKEKIEIILFNILSNALKYTSSGGLVLLGITETNDNVQINVKDSGAGISAEIGSKLFDSFYQAKNTEKSSQAGFGIGLHVSHRLSVAHKGNISYKSELGKGTTFTLTLLKGKSHFGTQPVNEELLTSTPTILQELIEDPKELNMEDHINENESKIIDKITSGLPKMVIVDDNAEMRIYIKEIFKDRFSIYEADDGTAAYHTIAKEIPNIVISDVMMSQMGGIELCKKMKETESLAHIPVILLTAKSSEEAKLQGIESGAEDYITKPFDKELIIARVENILKGRSRMQQYFFNTVTLKPLSGIENDHKEFIDRCIKIIENHLDDPDFTIPKFCREIGMSHPTLYKKIKSVSGLTVNVFIRYLRLRKAAEILINTDKKTPEVAYITGFNDVKYFREQFFKLFGIKPSEFARRYRKPPEKSKTATK